MKLPLIALVLLSQPFLIAGASAFTATPPAAGRWAALAFSRTRQWAGKAVSESSEFLAKTASVRGCAHSDCELKVYVERGCIAVANCSDRNLGTWHGFGATKYQEDPGDLELGEYQRLLRFQAQETARDSCMAAAHAATANVLDAYCTWDYEPFSADAVRRWIDSMGGERDPSVRSVLDLVNSVVDACILRLGIPLSHAACLSSRPRWNLVERFAVECGFTVGELERLWAAGGIAGCIGRF